MKSGTSPFSRSAQVREPVALVRRRPHTPEMGVRLLLLVPLSVESFQAPKGCVQCLREVILEQKGTGHWGHAEKESSLRQG